MSGRRRGSGPPRRRVGSVPVRPQILVFTEGERTEPDYVQAWHRRFRGLVNVALDRRHGTPLTIVRHAVQAKRDDAREARGGQGQAYDAIWCVFDVDEHPFMAETAELARAHEIHVALSNPCIELWFLLHFDDQRAHLDRHAAQRKADAHLGGGKGLDDAAFGRLTERHAVARERAQRLEAMHDGNGTTFPGNPHSGVWSLVDSLARR
jgi:hypothetical protein